jgi:hypothetical protein
MKIDLASLFGPPNKIPVRRKEKAKGRHREIKGVCQHKDGVRECENVKPDGSLGCTRERGHKGFHHGSYGDGKCGGSWE